MTDDIPSEPWDPKRFGRDLIDKKRARSRNILLAILISAVVIILLFFGLMFREPPQPKLPELNVSFFDKEINLKNFTEDFKANVTLSFPEKEIWDLGEVPWFVETITIEKAIPVKEVQGVIISGNSITYTLSFDNIPTKDLLWSEVYHLDSSIINPQVVSVAVYGEWEGSEISGSEELSVFSE